jgi:hypothetical protein
MNQTQPTRHNREMMNPDTKQNRSFQGADRVPQRFTFWWKRTILFDVILGIFAGNVLAFFTSIVVIAAEVRGIHTTVNGWSATLKCGRVRNGILLRAACAMDVAALNLPEEEVYWQSFVDSSHHRLNGQHDYILHFPPGGLPPNSGAWSVTMGDWRRFMVDNPIHRYSVGCNSGLAPNADGSIDVYIQNKSPAGHESNWLPAPSGSFMLWLRVYQPGEAILNGTYRLPPVVEVKAGHQ